MESTALAAKPKIEKLGASILVERLKTRDPALAENINDELMTRVVRLALEALATEINEREEGAFNVPGFGRITIRAIERERDGESINRKRVGLRPAKPKV